MQRNTREVEDYTTTCLVLAGVIVFMGLFAIWAMSNFAISLISGLVVHHVIERIPSRD